MHIRHTELDGRSVGRTSEPKVEVLSVLARFEEEDVVAGVQVSESVQSGVIVVRGLRVELCVFVSVGE